jgi:hypothetical protein
VRGSGGAENAARGLLWQPAEPAGVDDVDDGQRAAIVEVEETELGGGEVPEDPFRGAGSPDERSNEYTPELR